MMEDNIREKLNVNNSLIILKSGLTVGFQSLNSHNMTLLMAACKKICQANAQYVYPRRISMIVTTPERIAPHILDMDSFLNANCLVSIMFCTIPNELKTILRNRKRDKSISSSI